MSSLPTPISLEPGTEAFPLLTGAQIDRLRPYGKVRKVQAGEALFQAGDSNVPVYVILSGGLDILQPCPKDQHPVVSAIVGEPRVARRGKRGHGRTLHAIGRPNAS